MAAMNTSKPIQIFKAGTHTTAAGDLLSFSESDLSATAAAYDPKKHEAPLVVGHPKMDAPAYGWVGGLAFADGALEIEPVQVDPEFSEMVNRGAFKKISASFYSPAAPGNPSPGVYALKHVGFLGAAAPAVKGLRTPSFKEAEEGVIEFDLTAEFTETQSRGEIMSDADKARLTALETENGKLAAENEKLKTGNTALFAENEKLKSDAVAFAEAAATAKKAAQHTEHVAFAEGLIKAGKLLPARRDQTVAFMDNLVEQDSLVEFGEGAGKKSFTQLAIYREQLEAMPKIVEFKELAGGNGATGGVDVEDSTALAAKAVEFQEQEEKAGRTINIAQAVQHVSKQHKEAQL